MEPRTVKNNVKGSTASDMPPADKTNERVVIDKNDWILIIEFLKGIPIPFTETSKASKVLDAVNRAQIGIVEKRE
jgi:hypothetical protein